MHLEIDMIKVKLEEAESEHTDFKVNGTNTNAFWAKKRDAYINNSSQYPAI